ncbi:MAG TPA: tetratricopeptide repeat protein [Candidatus Acidoferrum sp.]|nr:tetratricopeptide repeat protein [Candidatus Acidoferrum sp.]
MNIAEKYRLPLVLVGILLLTLAIYWPGLSGPFVLDDDQNVVSVHLDHFDFDSILYMVTHNTSGMLGRIVSICSFLVSDLLVGLDSWGYKFHNLLLHMGVGVLLWQLWCRTLPLLVPSLDKTRTHVSATLATAFWLLHPLQVSTVLYVVQRMTILSSLFTLAALWCYVEARTRAQGDRRYWLLAFVLYPLLQALAVFSKENGALLPLFVLAYEVLVFRGWRMPYAAQTRHLVFLAVFIALPLLAGGLYLCTHLGTMLDYSTRNFTLGSRLLTQLHVVPTYLKLILLPRVRDMSLYHDDFPVTSVLDPPTLALLVLLLAMVAAIWLLRERASVLAFGLAWFLLAHLLESTVIPLELMFEHRNYLALAGVMLPLVHYVAGYRERKLALALLGVFFAVFALQTFSRTLEWSNNELMHRQAVADHPGSTRARTDMANLLTTQGKFAEALEQLKVAEQNDPKDAGILMHQLTLQCALGQSSPELVDHATEVLSHYPASVYAMNSFDKLYSLINSGKCMQVSREDVERMLKAAQSQPGNVSNMLTQGYLLRLQAFHDFLDGEYPSGVVNMRLAFDANHDIVILTELIQSQINFGQLQDAEDTLNFLREVNRQHHGIETYQVEKLEKSLREAREQPQAKKDQ